MIDIRRLKIEDGEAALSIAKIESEEFSSPLSEKSIIEMLDSDSYELWSLFDDDELCGYAVIAITDDEAHILSTASKYRRRGYALKLISRTMEELKHQAISCVYLEVRESNKAAIALYEKLDFVNDGLRKNIYDNPTEDGYMMHLRLD